MREPPGTWTYQLALCELPPGWYGGQPPKLLRRYGEHARPLSYQQLAIVLRADLTAWLGARAWVLRSRIYFNGARAYGLLQLALSGVPAGRVEVAEIDDAELEAQLSVTGFDVRSASPDWSALLSAAGDARLRWWFRGRDPILDRARDDRRDAFPADDTEETPVEEVSPAIEEVSPAIELDPGGAPSAAEDNHSIGEPFPLEDVGAAREIELGDPDDWFEHDETTSETVGAVVKGPSAEAGSPGDEDSSPVTSPRVPHRGLPPKSELPARSAPYPMTSPETSGPPMRGDPVSARSDSQQVPSAADDLRAVDLALYRPGTITRGGTPAAGTLVDPSTRLGTGLRYELHVRIAAGPPSPLFRRRPPSIDPLLPATEDGHGIEVTVFPIDFTLRGPSVQALWLPRRGATRTAAFAVQAPAQIGSARLRIVVSYRDHALQAFVITAEVARDEAPAHDRVLNAEIESATTARFTNLAALGPRGATGIVGDGHDGRHAISIKRGALTGTFRFADDQIRAATGAVRELLEGAARSKYFAEPPPTAGSAPHTERVAAFHTTMRQLAVLGAQLRLALFAHADADGKQLLRELASAENEALQLIHVTRSLVIPWASVYDGWMPADLDASRLEVCSGVRDDGAPCGHTAGSRVVCVRRFWGLRHQLELVLGAPHAGDAVTTCRVDPGRPALQILHGASLRDATHMPDGYLSLLYRPGVAVWDQDVYALLDGAQRPAIVVAMGHLSRTVPAPGTTVHAIDLVPQPLTSAGITQQAITSGEWTAPRSIVFLLACSSAVATVDALTSMIDAFDAIGAGAVVGTETTVFARLSARAACSLHHHLRDGEATLARAVGELRWELARDASPLGFAFTAYGNADLRLEVAS